MVCELTGMDVSNTGLYDVATATAEACLLATRVTRRKAVALLEPIHPGTAGVVHAPTRTARESGRGHGPVARGDAAGKEHACLVAQQPDFLGTIADLEPLDRSRACMWGALLVVVADPFALGLLRAPGDAGADIVTGEGRDLAGPPNYGGPSLGLFAARTKYLRQMPGRIVGRTRELANGNGGGEERTGYVLTLQAREQFIRRERATSNVSTAQALIAVAFTITVQALGPSGMRNSAVLCYQRAHDAASRIAALPGYETPERGPWFQEFLVRGPLPAADLAAQPRGARHRAGLRCVDPGRSPRHVMPCCSP